MSPMNQPMGMADFFTMEAGEYLERLDAMVSPVGNPDFEEFHRVARALRGSALMASQQQIANVASGLEALARAGRDPALTWEEAHRQLAIRAVDDLKVLVRAINNWTDAEDARAQQIITELQKVTGAAGQPERQVQELDAATRAFIAREGAAVGSALDQAAKTLARNPMGVSALDAVLRATQPLRGIASLSDLPPLPDLLDGIERAVQEMVRRKAPMPNPGDVFDAAAKAVSKTSQDIATAGRADPDGPEAQEFARLLGALLDMGPEIVPIEALYHADDGPHIVTRGAPPTSDDAPGELEMVSLGERLNQAAQDLEAAQSNTQRQLRAHGLAPTLRALEAAGAVTARFIGAVRNAVAGDAAVTHTARLAAALGAAGGILSSWGQQTPDAIAQRLDPIAATINGLGQRPIADAVAAPTPSAAGEPEVPTVEPVLEPPTPVEAAPEPTAPTATTPPFGADWLASGFSTYHELRALGNDGPVLGKIFLQAADMPAAATVPAVAPPADADEEGIAPITDYCYSGTAALKQAIALREKLAIGLPEDHQDLLQEIFDLVELGLQETS